MRLTRKQVKKAPKQDRITAESHSYDQRRPKRQKLSRYSR